MIKREGAGFCFLVRARTTQGRSRPDSLTVCVDPQFRTHVRTYVRDRRSLENAPKLKPGGRAESQSGRRNVRALAPARPKRGVIYY
jgi:hypothetical protein